MYFLINLQLLYDERYVKYKSKYYYILFPINIVSFR